MCKSVDQVRYVSHIYGSQELNRMAVPLFWDQQGYGLKPAPRLSPNRSHTENLDACRHHFARTVTTYGPHVDHVPVVYVKHFSESLLFQVIVNLAEQHGKEAAVTNAYRDCVAELKSKDLQ